MAPEPASSAAAADASSPVSPRPVLAVEQVRKSYGRGVDVLRGIDLELAAGEIVALIGPNGAGKTTLLSILAGLLPASGGLIRLWGEPVDLDRQPEKRRDVGLVLGGIALVEELRPLEYLEFIAAIGGVPRRLALVRAERLVDRFGLGAHTGKLIKQLSSGTRRKVELVAALLHEPALLLLDEPFEALDPPSAAEFTAVVREYVQVRGAAALVSSHILPWVEPLASDTRFLWDGRLYARSAIDGLLAAGAGGAELRAWAEVLAA